MIELKKAYCLNLLKRPLKRAKMKERFRKLKIEVEFVDAVDGEKATKVKGFKAGQSGVVYSMIKFLESKLNSKEEFIFFCEDDIIFCMDFHSRFKRFQERTPKDWKMLYLGWFPNAGGQTEKVSENVFRLTKQQGCFCMVFKTELIPEILEEMKKFKQVADNVFGWVIQTKFPVYGYKPYFCFVEPGLSDTWGTNMNYVSIKNNFSCVIGN